MPTLRHLLVTTLMLSGSILSVIGSSAATADIVELDQIIAVVEDDIIMASELDRRVQLIKQQNKGQRLPPDSVLQQQILDSMITESIQLQLADRSGIKVNENQLAEALNNIAASNKMSLEQFRITVAGDGISFNDIREQVRNEIRTSQVQRLSVGERIQISDQDIDYFLESDLGKMASSAEYRLRHILISVASEASSAEYQETQNKANQLLTKLRQGADFAEAAIAQSDSGTALKGGDLGWRKEAQLPSLFAPLVSDLAVGEIADLIITSSGFHIVQLAEKRGGTSKLVTQTKTRHILLQNNELRDEERGRLEIEAIYQQALAGADFAQLAKQHSDDPGSGAKGGDLGWVNPGVMVPEFEQVMGQTQEDGISSPFKSQFGWHILTVEGRRQTDVGEQLQRNQVRQMLYSRRFEEELPIWLRKMRGEAYIEIRQAADQQGS